MYRELIQSRKEGSVLSIYSVNAGNIHNSSDGCYLFDHCAGRNATLLVY